MQHYACGFLFSEDRSRVLLIRKNRPKWQAGRLNGFGGHVEEGESALEAMIRETKEEVGLSIPHWRLLAILKGSDFSVHFFEAFDDLIYKAVAMTDEELVNLPLSRLNDYPILPNLRLLIPMALNNSGVRKPVILTDVIYNDRPTSAAA